MKTFFVFIMIGTLSLNLVLSQEMDKIIKAFENSYTHESNGEYSKAMEVLKEVYKEDSYEINIRLGWLSYYSGLFTESAGYYQKSIGLMPYSIEARFGLVMPAASLGNWEQVIKTYEKILELDPNNATALYRLGMIYYGREEFQKSIKYFEKNVSFYPFTYDSLIMYAWCNYKVGKLREAKVLFNKVLMYSPTDESALEGLELIK